MNTSISVPQVASELVVKVFALVLSSGCTLNHREQLFKMPCQGILEVERNIEEKNKEPTSWRILKKIYVKKNAFTNQADNLTFQ